MKQAEKKNEINTKEYVNKSKNTNTSEKIGKSKNMDKTENISKTEDISKSKNASKSEDISKTKNASKSESISKSENVSKTENRKKAEITKKSLMLNALIKFLAGLLLMGLLLFLPAGTFDYPNAWLFMALLFIPMLFLGIVLLLKAPELLAKRLQSKEKESAQVGVVAFSALMFVGGFILAGLDYRFGWSQVPVWGTATAAVIMLVSYGMYAEVMRENAYLSRTVEVQENQKIVDTGLYGVVRHPMYLATIGLYLAIPVVLGSWISFFVFLLHPVIIVFRIRNEEMVLEQGLEGYKEYKQKVKYRLIPFIW